MYSKNHVFYSSCIGMLLFGIVMISLGTALPTIMAKYELSKMNAGFLTSLLPSGILFGSIIFGPVVDRYGYKLMLILCSILLVISFQLLALVESYLWLNISIFIIGFGGGVLNGGTNALVADISDEAKGAKLSLLGVSFGIGALGMPLLLSSLMSYYSFESIISAIGIGIIIPIIIFAIVKFPKPKMNQGFPLLKGLSLLKESAILLFGFILFFQSGLEGIVNNWLTSFLVDSPSFNQESALLVLTAFVAALTLARLIIGFIMNDSNTNTIYFTCLGTAVIGILFLIFTESVVFTYLSVFLIGIGLAPGFPIILGSVGSLYSHISGTAFSIVLVIALSGNILINYLMGITADKTGVDKMPYLLLTAMILMILIIVYTYSTKKKIN